MNNAQKPNGIDIERLVQASQDRNRGAFGELVKIFQRRAMQVAIGISGDADDAGEAVQSGFVKAYLNINKLKEPKRFEAWFLRIVANTAISQRKKTKKRTELTRAFNRYREQETISSQTKTENAVELKQAIQKAMSKLPKKQAQAISLFGLEDLSHREVAEIMGCSAESARWYVYQARKKLKVSLKEYLE